jgi:hypothetical protein
MNLNLLRKLYHHSTDICIKDQENTAWKWEKEFAKVVVKEYSATLRRYFPHLENEILFVERGHFHIE